jgi:hypothetical protein
MKAGPPISVKTYERNKSLKILMEGEAFYLTPFLNLLKSSAARGNCFDLADVPVTNYDKVALLDYSMT